MFTLSRDAYPSTAQAGRSATGRAPEYTVDDALGSGSNSSRRHPNPCLHDTPYRIALI